MALRALTALSLALVAIPTPVRAEGACPGNSEPYLITGYVRTEFSDYTADGTSVYTDEAIAAGSYNLPLGAYVWVEGVGAYRIADRGHLGRRHIDVAVWSRAEAFEITGTYCTWRIA